MVGGAGALTGCGLGAGAGLAGGVGVGVGLAVAATGCGVAAGATACAVASDPIAAPPELLVTVAALAGTDEVVVRAAVSRATWTGEVALVPETRPAGCCLSNELMMDSILEPAPIWPGG